MIDDVYQTALAAIRHHLDEAGATYTLDEGDVVVNGHRLGLSIAFEGFVHQGAHVFAPLDIQIHLDGDTGDRFRVGTLGVGNEERSAIREAISEWHLLAVAPLLAALGAAVESRRTPSGPQPLAGWDLFAGRVGIRGAVPAGLRSSETFYRSLMDPLRKVVGGWEQPNRLVLRSIYIMATRGPESCEIQAAVDGIVDEPLVGLLSALTWPAGTEAYLYKQLFVLRSNPRP